MKIEKVNDNQIRCTLTKEDLEDRQLKISEIAYGSEKAKSLFRDMMQQASYEFGFEAEDIPLMIEAIPMSSGCIVFIITKVEDPEELDTRFSKFAPSVHEDEDDDDEDELLYPEETDGPDGVNETLNELLEQLPKTPDDVYDLFRKISGKKAEEKSAGKGSLHSAGDWEQQAPDTGSAKPSGKRPAETESVRLFSFVHLDILTDAAHILNKYYSGESALFKNPSDRKYYLILTKDTYSTDDFIKLCNFLMEYGTAENSSPAILAYIEEHYTPILTNNAVAALAKI